MAKLCLLFIYLSFSRENLKLLNLPISTKSNTIRIVATERQYFNKFKRRWLYFLHQTLVFVSIYFAQLLRVEENIGTEFIKWENIQGK